MSDMNTYYYASRKQDFKDFITSLLRRGDLKQKYIDILTSNEGMNYYGNAFTASSIDSVNNYERFENMGDVTANKFIVWYAYQRFPQLDCTEGVKIVARLRINYGAKATFAPLAEKLGFWPFISCLEDGEMKGTKYRSKNKKDLLEDTFEAFIGCTEYLLDKSFRPGVGYGIAYDILTNIFDEINISLKFEDLFDAKTRLKETFDQHQDLGGWCFIDKREEIGDEGHTVAISTLYRAPIGTESKAYRKKTGVGKNDYIEYSRQGWIELGSGVSSSKGDAQQKAADQGITLLKKMGYYRTPPEEYERLSK